MDNLYPEVSEEIEYSQKKSLLPTIQESSFQYYCGNSYSESLKRIGRQVILHNTNEKLIYIILLASTHLYLQPKDIEQNVCQSCSHQLFTNHYLICYKGTCTSERDIDSQIQKASICAVAIEKKTMKIDHFIFEEAAKSSVSLESNSTKVEGSVQMSEKIQNEPDAEQYVLYINKIKRDIYETQNNNLFHQNTWSPDEIAYIMTKAQCFYGDKCSIIMKRTQIILKYSKKNINASFKDKYNLVCRRFLFKQHQSLQNTSLTYYVISKDNIIENQAHRLFILPKSDKIVDFLMVDPWLVIAASEYLMFLHDYNPMEYFRFQEKINPTKLVLIQNQKGRRPKVVALLKNKKFIVYQIQETVINVQATFETLFLIPYSFCLFKNQGIFISGNIVEESGIISVQRTISLKKKIFFMQDIFPSNNLIKGRSLKADDEIQVLKLELHKYANIPIKDLIYIESENVIICSWFNLIQVFDVSTKNKVIEVSLKSQITRCIELPYVFNLFNILVQTKQKQLVRVGFQNYGDKIATEIAKYKTEGIEHASIRIDEKNKKLSLIQTDSNKIYQFNYVSQKIEHQFINYQQEQIQKQIIKLDCNQQGIAYLLNLSHSVEVCYLEF